MALRKEHLIGEMGKDMEEELIKQIDKDIERYIQIKKTEIVMFAIVARCLLPDKIWDEMLESAELQNAWFSDENRVKIYDLLEHCVNEQAKKCREKDSRSPYLA